MWLPPSPLSRSACVPSPSVTIGTQRSGGGSGSGESQQKLTKLRSHVTKSTSKILVRKPSSVGVLCFEVAGMMSKLLLLHSSVSDASVSRLRHDTISLDGVRKIVSNDDSFLLRLACAEILHNLRLLATSASSYLSLKSDDPNLRSLLQLFDDFAERGRDPFNWVLSAKELESLTRKLERLIAATSLLYREMEALSTLENCLRKSQNSSSSTKAETEEWRICFYGSLQDTYS